MELNSGVRTKPKVEAHVLWLGSFQQVVGTSLVPSRFAIFPLTCFNFYFSSQLYALRFYLWCTFVLIFQRTRAPLCFPDRDEILRIPMSAKIATRTALQSLNQCGGRF